ncbi:hypothetical protein, partial [Eshraghiella crossota]|uniref:hypothetical protein n=1 Tax=Eshraghiella crossota TaxID=45851 RepID=UPI003FEE9539
KDKGESLESANDYCIGNGILKDILRKNRNEVRSKSLFEFDAEEHEKAIKQIAYEDGRAELILSMFNSGKTPEQISDFCGLDLKEVKKIIEQSDGNSLDN